MVESQPNVNVPVFQVRKEGTDERRVLHRNLLLPIGSDGRPIPKPRSPPSQLDISTMPGDLSQSLLEVSSSELDEMEFLCLQRLSGHI